MPTSLVSTGVQFPDSTTQTTAGVTPSGSATLTNKTISGANNTLTNISLSSSVTGTLPVANGGTGSTSLTANNVLLGNGTSALQTVAPGTNGNILVSNGTTWVSQAPAGGGNYTLLQNITVSTASSSVDITGISDTYRFYRVLVYIPSTGSAYVNTLRIVLLDSTNTPLPQPGTGRTYYANIGLGSEIVGSPFTAKESTGTAGFWTVNNASYQAADNNPTLLDFTLVKSLDGVRPSHGVMGTIWGNQSTYPVPSIFAGGYGTYDSAISTPNLRGIRLNNTSGQNLFVANSSIQLWGWKTTG